MRAQHFPYMMITISIIATDFSAPSACCGFSVILFVTENKALSSLTSVATEGKKSL